MRIDLQEQYGFSATTHQIQAPTPGEGGDTSTSEPSSHRLIAALRRLSAKIGGISGEGGPV